MEYRTAVPARLSLSPCISQYSVPPRLMPDGQPAFPSPASVPKGERYGNDRCRKRGPRRLQAWGQGARYGIIFLAPCGNMLQQTIQRHQLCLIGCQCGDGICIFCHTEQVTPHPCLCDFYTEGILHGRGNRNLFQFIRREIHFQKLALFQNGQCAAQGLEGDGVCVLFKETEQHISRTQCCMTAEVNFAAGGKPSEVIACALLYGKGGFRTGCFRLRFSASVHRRGICPVHRLRQGCPSNTFSANAST